MVQTGQETRWERSNFPLRRKSDPMSAGGLPGNAAVTPLHPNRLVTALTITPFVAFAGGIAIGTDWATWH